MKRFHRPMLALAVVGAGAGVWGCRVSSFHVSAHDDHPPVRPVYVHDDHHCGHSCHDHYWDGNRVVVLGGHRHAPGCGHDWDGHNWIVIRKGDATHVHRNPSVQRVHDGPEAVVRVNHAHDDHCGCAYHPHKRAWVVVGNGHRHGPGCGHVWIEGRWTLRY